MIRAFIEKLILDETLFFKRPFFELQWKYHCNGVYLWMYQI